MSALEGWLQRPGPTEAVSLVRLLLGLVVWCEVGERFRLEESLGPEPERVLLGALVWVGSTGMVLGARSAASSLLTGLTLAVCWQWLGLELEDDHFRRHHLYALAAACTLLSMTPCGGSLSLDRWLAVRRARATGAPLPPQEGDLWAVPLLQLQVAAIYVFAAWDKSWPAFHHRMEHYASDLYFGAEHPGPWFTVVMAVAGYGSVALEYALPFGLWWAPTRRVALVVGLSFHAFVYWSMSVASFSVTMATLYLLFVDPRSVRRVLDDVTARG